VVICCGHFADGAEKFTPAALEGETRRGKIHAGRAGG
jgi:hypothetical protein